MFRLKKVDYLLNGRIIIKVMNHYSIKFYQITWQSVPVSFYFITFPYLFNAQSSWVLILLILCSTFMIHKYQNNTLPYYILASYYWVGRTHFKVIKSKLRYYFLLLSSFYSAVKILLQARITFKVPDSPNTSSVLRGHVDCCLSILSARKRIHKRYCWGFSALAGQV